MPVLEGVVLGGADEAVKKALIDRGRLLRVTHRSELAKGDPRPEFTELRITAHATSTRPKLELTFFNHRLVSVRVFSSDNRALLKSLIEDSRVGTTDHPMLASINTPPTGTACVYLVHAALMKAVDAWIRKYS